MFYGYKEAVAKYGKTKSTGNGLAANRKTIRERFYHEAGF
jgi:hypothetical protein